MSHRLLCLTLVVGLLLGFGLNDASAQERPTSDAASIDSVQVQRLADLSALYGVVSFFHPRLPDRAAAWDSAYAAAARQVATTGDSAAHFGAARDLLGVLDDPATRLQSPLSIPHARSGSAEEQPAVRWAADSVLVATLKPSTIRGRRDAVHLQNDLRSKLPDARGVVLDVRNSGPIPVGRFLDRRDDLKARMAPKPYPLPGTQTRMHEGFAPEGGRSSGGYASYSRTEERSVVQPAAETNVGPVVVLASEGDVVPAFALGLQRAGHGVVLREGTDGPPVRTPVSTHTQQLFGGPAAEVRLGTPRFPDETRPPGAALTIAPSDDTTDRALNRALQIARGESPLPEAESAGPVTAATGPHSFTETAHPALGTRLLAVARAWSIIEHFFPYKDLMDQPWSSVLPGAIRKAAAAESAEAFHRAIAEMMAQTGDSHVRARSPVLSDVLGEAPAAVRVRSIEKKPVVTRVVDSAVAETTAVAAGDVILEVDGTPAEARRDSLARFGRGASTPQARRLQTASNLLDGAPGSTATVRVRKPDGSERVVDLPRGDYDLQGGDAEEPVLRRLTDRIGYADLDRLGRDRVNAMFARFSDTDAIVFDMRGYPEGTAWAIAPRLAETSRPVAASFAKPLRLGPGEVGRQTIAFNQRVPPRRRGSQYTGETVMLMDARTISQAEHTGLFLKAANGTTFVGSPTRGADGDVTRLRLPGGITVGFTGQAVRHPDGAQLQRRGLQPDVEARPTIESVRRGDDVVLQKAIEHLQTTLGSGES